MNKELIDHVWKHCLPKEFKEAVKKLYTDALDASNSPHEPDDRKWGNYRVTLLEKLFGYHNLTSDGEGEEMLTVSRKEVMRNFAEKVAWKNHHQSSKHDRDMAAGWCNALHFLFGSKCLPDENKECSNPSVVNCKHKHGDGTCSLSGMCCYKSPKPAEPEEKDDCQKFTKTLDDTLEGEIKEPFKEWYDKNYSNVEKLEKNGEVEPKPAKPKFKVGDKVRYKEFVGTVYQIEETDYVIRNLAGGDLIGWLKESDLEPYTEPKEEASKMKPIKSKVRVYLVTKEEDEEFRQLLHKNGFEWNTGESLIDNSVWSFDKEESKIHNIYPNKIVTYSGDITPNILSFYKFKKQYFEENANLSQETSNCDNHFDNIFKDSFAKERRLNIAAMIIQGIMANPNPQMVEMDAHRVADLAILMADTLIVECEKGGRK